MKHSLNLPLNIVVIPYTKAQKDMKIKYRFYTYIPTDNFDTLN